MADNQEWQIYGPNGTRTTNDPGAATVIGGSGDATPSYLAPLAYTAGGGALGYMLSKWLMGDDEETGKDGKKKDKGALRSIVPWLAAAAGAYGGHLLSGSWLSDKGMNGEFAFRKNKDGTLEVPKSRPWSGKVPNAIGNKLMGASAIPFVRGGFSAAANRPARLQGKIDSLIDEMSRVKGKPRYTAADTARLDALKAELKKTTEKHVKSVGRSSTPYGRLVGALGKQAPGRWGSLLNTKGSFLTSAGLMASGLLGRLAGHVMNGRRRAAEEAMRLAGVQFEED